MERQRLKILRIVFVSAVFVVLAPVLSPGCGKFELESRGHLDEPCFLGEPQACRGNLVCVDGICRNPTDGDTETDGDTAPDGDTQDRDTETDGDNLDGDSPDGDNPPDGDTSPDGDAETDRDAEPDQDEDVDSDPDEDDFAVDGDSQPDGDAEPDADGDVQPDGDSTIDGDPDNDDTTMDGDIQPDGELDSDADSDREPDQDGDAQPDGDLPDGDTEAELICANGVCLDLITGLEWQQEPTGGTMTWEATVTHCQDLSLDGPGWSLPTISELRSLIRGCTATQTGGSCNVTDDCLSWNPCRNDPCDGCPDDQGPTDGCYWASPISGACSWYWSSSSSATSEAVGWYIDFGSGYVLSHTTVPLTFRSEPDIDVRTCSWTAKGLSTI